MNEKNEIHTTKAAHGSDPTCAPANARGRGVAALILVAALASGGLIAGLNITGCSPGSGPVASGSSAPPVSAPIPTAIPTPQPAAGPAAPAAAAPPDAAAPSAAAAQTTAPIGAAPPPAAAPAAKDSGGPAGASAPAKLPAAAILDAIRPQPPTGQPSTDPARPCDARLVEIRKDFADIPEDYHAAKSIEDLVRTAQKCQKSCEEYLAACKDGAGAPEAKFMLARILLLLRERVSWPEFMKKKSGEGLTNEQVYALLPRWTAEYNGRVVELAGSALEGLEKGSKLRARCLDLLGDAYLQLGEHEKALERYKALLDENPSFERRSDIYLGMARAYRELNRPAEGIDLLQKAIHELPSSPSVPYFHEALWGLLTVAGDLPGLLKEAEETRDGLAKFIETEGAKLKQYERDVAERVRFFDGFRLGYIRFALGDYPGAKRATEDHLRAFDALQGALPKGRSLPSEFVVTKGRSELNLKVLDALAGRPAPESLSAIRWIGPRRLERDGTTQAILFGQLGYVRSDPFVQALDRYARENPRKVQLAVVAALKGRPGADQVEDAIREQGGEAFGQATNLGLDCALGLDPDPNHGIFKAFEVWVGTPTLVILDRDGNVAWYQQDPLVRDVKFSTAVLERISGGH